ncbi:transcriptional repressor [Hirschia baltica]|uniref:Putative zinc transport-related regulatory protein n=1 Tax=Hirschia baltica (strain ATCC 49814 / DSM 5838 / IFAM 1418) TaxID=582402 RepID=C6XQN4_HIRBI|nr:transcriptional repressor [Hirschia baltica]ACT58640.1 putative zinc transport-related regulatory protein [Hirschia baltica ATCC 49814]
MTETHLSCSSGNPKDALAEAARISEENGVRLTPLRKRVLELLLAAKSPAKAYDLLEQLSKEDTTPAKPPTIYRALDFLLQQGLAHKIESLNAYVACGHRGHGHAAAFLICERCESAKEMHAESTFSALKQETQDMSFKFLNAVIEVRGICEKCQISV